MQKLAINGGPKIREEYFPAYKTIGKEELQAVQKVIETGVLSGFLASWGEAFFGGSEILKLEEAWKEKFDAKYAIAVNSATSGLYCAMGATGVGPGDEVIVSPLTMSASSVAPLLYNAIPVFADIEDDYFCLSPESIEERITKNTKAIVVTNIAGLSYAADEINAIAEKHNLLIVEDNAQAPGAMYKGRWTGNSGDMGVYSLNVHKHVHTGEGGIVVTDDDELAKRVRLIRNHAENVVGGMGYTNLNNMIGFNYRMTEIEAAMAWTQLQKLTDLVEKRVENVEYLADKIKGIPCIEPAKTRPGCKHVYYVHCLKFNKEIAGVHRDVFVEAVKAELTPFSHRVKEGPVIRNGYSPIHLLPIFQQKRLYGGTQFPWNYEKYDGNVSYEKGICPVAERLGEYEMIRHELMHAFMTKKDMDDVADAFQKVWDNIDELR